ncbi:MAG: dTDP-4-dehydrorhamnose 3,5-epimerase family protein, partial [Flavobacteriaceae bacterium]
MRFNPTTIKGCWLIEPMLHGDDRGSFMETYREDLFN